MTGPLQENERRLVLARAILGEWLGGSGGGWQDSGGVWPGIKLIQGVLAQEGDAEFGMSRGCLMPTHHILDSREAPPEVREKLGYRGTALIELVARKTGKPTSLSSRLGRL